MKKLMMIGLVVVAGSLFGSTILRADDCEAEREAANDAYSALQNAESHVTELGFDLEAENALHEDRVQGCQSVPNPGACVSNENRRHNAKVKEIQKNIATWTRKYNEELNKWRKADEDLQKCEEEQKDSEDKSEVLDLKSTGFGKSGETFSQ